MAVSILIKDFPKTITSDAFDLKIVVDGAKSGTNYFRIEVYKEGTTNYFGETFNGKDWYSGTSGKEYFPFEISSKSSEINIKGRLGNPTTSEFSGSGEHKLKVKRYTASGNAANDEETPVSIEINYNQESPTPIATEVSSPTPFPTNELETISPTVSSATKAPEVLAYEAEIPLPDPTTIVQNKVFKRAESVNILAPLIFALGLFILGFFGFLIYRNKRKIL